MDWEEIWGKAKERLNVTAECVKTATDEAVRGSSWYGRNRRGPFLY